MKNKPFALRVQTILIFVLLGGFLLIGQTVSQLVYTIGAVCLIISALFQINFGNINSDSDLKKTALAFIKNLIIIALVFTIGIQIAPLFLDRAFMRNIVTFIAYGTVAVFLVFIILGSRIGRGRKDGE
jgi:hypothetical protein